MSYSRIPDEVKRKARELREQGTLSDQAIANQLGINRSNLRLWFGARPARANSTEPRKAEALRLRNEEKLTNGEIARRMEASPQTVWQWIGSSPHKYQLKNKNVYPPAVRAEARRLRDKEKLSNPKIAHRLGTSLDTISRWIGKSPPDCLTKPNKNYSHLRLHDRAMYLRECGYTIREIEEIIHVPHSTVGDWVLGYGCYGQPTER